MPFQRYWMSGALPAAAAVWNCAMTTAVSCSIGLTVAAEQVFTESSTSACRPGSSCSPHHHMSSVGASARAATAGSKPPSAAPAPSPADLLRNRRREKPPGPCLFIAISSLPDVMLSLKNGAGYCPPALECTQHTRICSGSPEECYDAVSAAVNGRHPAPRAASVL